MLETQTIGPDDTARARRSDPLPSHVAADKSATSRRAVRDAVLFLLWLKGDRTGQELNDLYAGRAVQHGWPIVHFDSPRKRVAELVREGLVTVVNPDDPRGTPAVYRLVQS